MIGPLYLGVIALSWIGTWGLVRRFGRLPSAATLAPTFAIVGVAFLAVDVVGLARGWFSTPT